MGYQRPMLDSLIARIKEPRRFIQVLAGPRQVGKTTMALALTDEMSGIAEYHTADDAVPAAVAWIDGIWESLRIRMNLEGKSSAVLILDELQKIPDWSAAIKRHWDRDTREMRDIRLIISGSSRLLLADGLSESLMGRYELNYAGHWGLAEMQGAFGFSTEQYQWFGGYPGAAALASDEARFKEYIRNSIIEPTMTRDILMTAKIDKPALLRQLLDVGITYSAKIMSYNKMLGQLQDAGNTTTLAKYLRLLDQAGLLSGLNKYSGREIATKGTIPKLQVQNAALLSGASARGFEEAVRDRAKWGSVVESSVGAYLAGQANRHPNTALYYWRENGAEIDYVVTYGEEVVGIEVKSGDEGISAKASDLFMRRFPEAKLVLVGKHGIPYETFMNTEIDELISSL